MQNSKQLICFLVFTIFVMPFSFADEAKNGLAIGSSVVMDSGKSGGVVEISFPLFGKSGFFIRNAVIVGGFGNDTDGIFTAGDKIMMGGKGMNNTASYGFISASAGTFQNDSEEFFSSPLLLDFTGGGGFEIHTSADSSFAVEAGGGLTIAEDDISGYAHLAAIFRIYLN